jgi:glycosyl transferase, family 25
MRVYIISLYDSSNDSNSRLSSLLERNGYTVCFVKAIDGARLSADAYFSKSQPYLHLTGRLLSPAELGCTLSHAEAYKELLRSNEERALILEDDVIVDSEACAKLALLLSLDINRDSFIHLGGYDGFRYTSRPARGILRYRNPCVFEVASDDLCYLHGTFGYILSSYSADNLTRALMSQPFLIDDFNHFKAASQVVRFYCTQIVRHPPDHHGSQIQDERKRNGSIESSGSGLAYRIMMEVNKTINNRLKLVRSKWKYRGYRLLGDDF